MQDSVKLKKSLFGFKKSSVQNYFSEVSHNIDDKMFLKDNEIKTLKKTIENLNEEKKQLNKQIDEFKEEKEKIAQMYINAQETSEQIISAAKTKADSIIAEAVLRSNEEKEKTDKIIADAEEMIHRKKEQAELEQQIKKKEYDKEIEEKRAIVEKCKLEITSLQSKIKITLNNFNDIISDIIKS